MGVEVRAVIDRPRPSWLNVCSRRIINEVPCVSCVVYDVSGNPLATIEWVRKDGPTTSHLDRVSSYFALDESQENSGEFKRAAVQWLVHLDRRARW